MCNLNEWIVREAYRAYERGDTSRMMDFVDPDLEWTFLDPDEPDARPRTCYGRAGLEEGLRRQAKRGLRTEVEQVIAAGANVILVTRTPGLGRYRGVQADDQAFDVVTVRDNKIVGLRACRDRAEAWSIAEMGRDIGAAEQEHIDGLC